MDYFNNIYLEYTTLLLFTLPQFLMAIKTITEGSIFLTFAPPHLKAFCSSILGKSLSRLLST